MAYEDAIGNFYDYEKADGTCYLIEVLDVQFDEDVHFVFDVSDYDEDRDEFFKIDVDYWTGFLINDWLERLTA